MNPRLSADYYFAASLVGEWLLGTAQRGPEGCTGSTQVAGSRSSKASGAGRQGRSSH